ncbi:hypothetical protein CONPUDRAFT_119310 [Coniophora puteana RWD-64-598 SS2]|uniref:ARM repeat-containing protein n=1 Tax=Coniophora puteana (strain RWD-64-598) TaxID=741705 RepID=A0A5M3MXR2_CONPW|nr:uncharacterized protein CONPUDRAFT_119310 [Coniophora puteana RWD-64-598 SS2]EIW83902.1 hypothetical protein CONPUDRAFT_119310 [Coniophora puteana RWD-64-598 SS2]
MNDATVQASALQHQLCSRQMTYTNSIDSHAFGTLNAITLENLGPIVPLRLSVNRWVASSIGSAAPMGWAVDMDSPEVVDRKVRALLNKLTMKNFDSISDQIIAWANKSEKEEDAQTLVQVIRLVFERATVEAAWNGMHARLCRKMMEQISEDVQDYGIKNAEGKPIAGGQLFRKHLLNRCQEEFERGWPMCKATAVAARSNSTIHDEKVKVANEKIGVTRESELYWDELYAIQKAGRRGLGLIKFISELFKLHMLTERIMHECVKKLLGNVEIPKEDEIEGLCQLLTTAGQMLDTPKAKAHMGVYFQRMKELARNGKVSLRVQFVLMDVIELRERKWTSRKAVARGFDHDTGHPGGCLAAGKGSLARPPPKVGDLSQFGKISKQQPLQTFGPSSVFKKNTAKQETNFRTSSSSNMFRMLSQSSPLRYPFVAVGTDDALEASPEHSMLRLLPRIKSTEITPAMSEDVTKTSAKDGPGPMTEAQAEKKIDQNVHELFGVRCLEEAEVYFTDLPKEHHFRLVMRLVDHALESKETDVKLLADFFSQATSKGQCDAATFEEGFLPVAELLDDTAVDAPKAVDYMAMLVRGTHLDKDKEKLKRIAEKSEFNSEKFLRLVAAPSSMFMPVHDCYTAVSTSPVVASPPSRLSQIASSISTTSSLSTPSTSTSTLSFAPTTSPFPPITSTPRRLTEDPKKIVRDEPPTSPLPKFDPVSMPSMQPLAQVDATPMETPSTPGGISQGVDIEDGVGVVGTSNVGFVKQGAHSSNENHVANSVVLVTLDGKSSVPQIAHNSTSIGPAPPGLPVNPDPSRVKWSYIDSSGNVQGPFAADSMQKWLDEGYFPLDLQVKRTHIDREFINIGELERRAGGDRPFLSQPPPSVPPRPVSRTNAGPLPSSAAPKPGTADVVVQIDSHGYTFHQRIPPSNVFKLKELGIQPSTDQKGDEMLRFHAVRDKAKAWLQCDDLQLVTSFEVICMGGTAPFKPCFIMRGKARSEGWCEEDEGHSFVTSESNWANKALCSDWFLNVFFLQARAHADSTAQPIVIIFHEHSLSPLITGIADVARSNNVILFCLPSLGI